MGSQADRPMTTGALIVGANGYARWPLQSAVRDALAFREMLIDLKLVGARNIKLLTSPEEPGSDGPATRQQIRDALLDVYLSGDAYDRYFVYYSGHGVLTFKDHPETQTRTVLLPADVSDLVNDGDRMIDFTKLLELMQFAGPREQFYIVDACRDIAFDNHPQDLGGLVFPKAKKSRDLREQGGLYAAAPFGRALGHQDELGVVTGDLLRAMRSDLEAIVPLGEVPGDYHITMRSLFARVHETFEDRIRLVTDDAYRSPVLIEGAANDRTLRIPMSVEPVPFVVNIQPDEAADGTSVDLYAGGYVLPKDLCYPARANHEVIHVQPRRHHMRAISKLGETRPAEHELDMRRDRDQTVFVDPPPWLREDSDARPVPPITERTPSRDTTRIEAHADDPRTEIVLRPLEGADDGTSALHALSVDVAPGPYEIAFRFGDDTFCGGIVSALHDETLTVEAAAPLGPLLREAYGIDRPRPARIHVDEQFDSIQVDVLATMLSLIGLKALDPDDAVLPEWSRAIPAPSSHDLGDRPVAVVVAVEGDRWNASPDKIRDSLYAAYEDMAGDGRQLHLRQLAALDLGEFNMSSDGTGFDRIVYDVVRTGTEPFSIRVTVPGVREFNLQCASVPEHGTIVCLVVRSDGSFDALQHVVELPGAASSGALAPIDRLTDAVLPLPQVLRFEQLAQRLFACERPYAFAAGPPDDAFEHFVDEMFRGRYADPLVGCMAYYAAARILPFSPALPRSYGALGADDLRFLANNLIHRFPDLPDAHVVAGVHELHAYGRTGVLDGILASYHMPVLAESVLRLAHYAKTADAARHPVVQAARIIVPGQPWTVSFEPLPIPVFA